MPLDVAKFRNWARIPHTIDDPAIVLSYAAAVRELEERTGWCYDQVTRAQYVAEEPEERGGVKLLLLSRQPATSASTGIAPNITIFTLVEINGMVYAQIPDGLTYPLTVTIGAGNGTINELLEMALLQRVTQLVNSRGDDTQTLPGDYWDRICPMFGKAIG